MPGIKSNGKLCGDTNHLTFPEHRHLEFIKGFPPLVTQYATTQKSEEEIKGKGSERLNGFQKSHSQYIMRTRPKAETSGSQYISPPHIPINPNPLLSERSDRS